MLTQDLCEKVPSTSPESNNQSKPSCQRECQTLFVENANVSSVNTSLACFLPCSELPLILLLLTSRPREAEQEALDGLDSWMLAVESWARSKKRVVILCYRSNAIFRTSWWGAITFQQQSTKEVAEWCRGWHSQFLVRSTLVQIRARGLSGVSWYSSFNVLLFYRATGNEKDNSKNNK